MLVPQIMTDPTSIVGRRWRDPFTAALDMGSAVGNTPYLQLLVDFDGAQVYAVEGAESSE